MVTSHTVCLYGLSTCVHCRHAREFLEANKVIFDCVYVDRLEGEERSKTIAVVKGHNPRISFPTIVLDEGAKVLVGFKEEDLKEALEL